MNKILYVVPNIEKVSGGPRTRISMFKAIFLGHGEHVIEGKGKLRKAFASKKKARVYVESATNRISFVDFLSLLYLKCISKEITVFIRDIYIELFPEEYSSLRGRITMLFNKTSNLFLTLISDKMGFPTKEMGNVFFKKNTWFPKREYFALPPGCIEMEGSNTKVDFSKPLGILYLGGISYPNSGFQHYLDFAEKYKGEFNFFVLSGDLGADEMTKGMSHIKLEKVKHEEIPKYIAQNNIFMAFHSRPKNEYDDITFPIKVLDFIGIQLPFVTARHKPIIDLLGKDYDLFVDISNIEEVYKAITNAKKIGNYTKLTNHLKDVALKNSYEDRYRTVFEK